MGLSVEPSFEHWRAALLHACGRFHVEADGAAPGFSGSVRLQRGGGLELVAIAGQGARAFRDHRDVAAEDGKYYFLVLQGAGEACMSQGGERAELAPGDLVLIDACQPCDFRYRGAWTQLSCHLPRPRVAEAFRHRRLRPGTRIAGDSRLGALLGHLLLDAHAGIEQLEDGEGAAMQQALLALLPPALAPEAPPVGADEALYRRARALIEERLAEPGLGPAQIAAAVGVSLRQLHRLFARRGQTVARLVQERRLERCARDLADHGCDASITAIAFFWGFSDAAHFARSFKTRYGRSPRDYRQAARG